MLPRVASYRRQPRAIESTTPMGLRHHQPLIITPQHEDEDNIAVELRPSWPFITAPQRGVCPCNNIELCTAWPFITAPQRDDGPRHGIYHHATMRGVPMPQRGVAPIIAHSLPRHDIEMVRGNMGCDHAIAWDCPINIRGMRAKRRGRGYPEGVIPSTGQG